MNRRVVITGMGAVTPLGNDKDTFWSSIKNGVCGIAPITAFDTANHKVKIAAEVKIDSDSVVPPAEARKMDRSTLLGVIAADEALRNSGINPDNADITRCGVISASGIGGLSTMEREHSRGLEKGFDRISPYFIPMVIPNMTAGRISINSGFLGYSASVVTACAGGTNAIGDAARMIRHGYADVMMAGGAEAVVTPLAMGGFTSMKALTENNDPCRASIPFDSERSGFVMGEGAGMLMLEELEHALCRRAKIYAEISGYGATGDAHHITAPEPSGMGAARAMSLALADVGFNPEEIDYINAHGTSTPLNDKCETLAIKEVFGKYAVQVPVSSTKSMTGHLLGAAGAIEAIVCAFSVGEGFLPANINYRIPDPECDLNIVANQGRAATVNHAMSNSLGFGGHNASLIISRYHK